MAALALYVHWPYCARICPYCDFNVYRARGRTDEAQALEAAILADLEMAAAELEPQTLVSIFFGGGTPSLARPQFIARLIDRARALFAPAPDLEITLEANPTDLEAGRWRDFAQAGVERLSLGLQSLDDPALSLLGRDHDAAMGLRAVEAARAVFARLSVDMIYALPGQGADAWAQSLEQVSALGADHISPYQLTIEAGTAFERAVRRGTLVPQDPDAAARLYEITQTVLGAQGFEAYEVSNHARGAAARSRHNLHVWRGGAYLGLGPGAHGRLEMKGLRRAQQAVRRPTAYIEQVAHTGRGLEDDLVLGALEAAEERVLLGLRLAEGLALTALEAAVPEGLTTRLKALAQADLVQTTAGRVRATAAGRLLLDYVMRQLLT